MYQIGKANLYKIHRYRCKTDSAHILWNSLQGRSDRKQQLNKSGSNRNLRETYYRKRTRKFERVSQAGASGALGGLTMNLSSQCLTQRHHTGNWKLTTVGVFAPWKLVRLQITALSWRAGHWWFTSMPLKGNWFTWMEFGGCHRMSREVERKLKQRKQEKLHSEGDSTAWSWNTTWVNTSK